MASTYNPYSDIEKVYNAKVAWNNATTDEERNKQNSIATAARKQLEAYGYSDVANQISASGADATAARKIMEQYAPKTTTTTDTNYTNTELITKNNNEVNSKINNLWGTQNSDREMMTGKYNKLEDTAYSNPFTTDEAKAILAKYDLAGLQGRDNAVASGGASNGGNIDSYSAANAMRQQAALVNQGQMAVLDAHNNRIANVQSTLEGLGVYLQNQDKGMQNTIGLQQNEGQRLFENDETSKNNEVARLSEQASVTGYVPKQWQYSNNPYFNSDGTLNEVYLSKDFDNTGGFTTIINNAKAKLATTTDATEKANLEATIKYATQAKAYKTLNNPQYAQYAHEVSGVTPDITEAARTTNLTNETALKSLGIEADLSRYGIDMESKSKLDQINAQKDAEKELLEFQTLLTGGNTAVFTSDQTKEVDKVVSQINEKLSANAQSNPKADNLINPAVNGKYSFSGTSQAPTVRAWRWEIVPIVYNSGLTAQEKATLYTQLGLSGEEVAEVYKSRGYIN